ncbi:hypothetical protein Y032_0015g2785 [Ancylostoma ceylanicum]|uniref:Uncharacterized protein n=1 Tax=Ancylostoma ceylanicum TaxID=53326 RepID=A0A016VAD5_9BILA|nr:hypothetical protein Y032_0015g2785 [Ancylostoma ceylanicum]
MAMKRRGNVTSPLGRHRVETHSGNDFNVKCIILAFENDIAERKVLEAAWISTRNPGMNNRNECLSITSLVPSQSTILAPLIFFRCFPSNLDEFG